MQHQQIQRAESGRKSKLREKAGRGQLQNPRTVLARERLPNRRASETFNFEVEGLLYCATVSFFPDGRINEIFISNHKVGSQSDANATDVALAASLALQHGCTLDVLRGALLRDMGNRAATTRMRIDPLVGIEINLPRHCPCGHDMLHVGPTRGQHRASLQCTRCGRQCGWLSNEITNFLTAVFANFGRPTAPVYVRVPHREL